MTLLSLRFCNSSLDKIGRRVSAKILICVIANISCFDFEHRKSQEKKRFLKLKNVCSSIHNGNHGHRCHRQIPERQK